MSSIAMTLPEMRDCLDDMIGRCTMIDGQVGLTAIMVAPEELPRIVAVWKFITRCVPAQKQIAAILKEIEQ